MKYFLIFFILCFISQLIAQLPSQMEGANYAEATVYKQSYPQNFMQLQEYSTDEEVANLDKKIAKSQRRAKAFGLLSLGSLGIGLLAISQDDSATTGIIYGAVAIVLGSIFGLMGIGNLSNSKAYENKKKKLIESRGSSNQDIGFSLRLGVTNHGLGLKILF